MSKKNASAPSTIYGFPIFISEGERRARAPLPAVAEGYYRVEVVITGKHRSRTAGSGCHDAAHKLDSGHERGYNNCSEMEPKTAV